MIATIELVKVGPFWCLVSKNQYGCTVRLSRPYLTKNSALTHAEDLADFYDCNINTPT